MSRGVSKSALVNAVLEGISELDADTPAREALLADVIIRKAQPCQIAIDVQLEGKGKSERIKRTVNVLGLRGAPRASVSCVADDQKRTIAAALDDLRSLLRQRVDAPLYRMLVLELKGASKNTDTLFEKLAVLEELAVAALPRKSWVIELFSGEQRQDEGSEHVSMPVALVVSAAA